MENSSQEIKINSMLSLLDDERKNEMTRRVMETVSK